MDTYHVLRDNEFQVWFVRKEGEELPLEYFFKKDDAVSLGRELAQRSILGQLTIHNRDGSIESVWTYGADPVG